jgi:hypothetical protein
LAGDTGGNHLRERLNILKHRRKQRNFLFQCVSVMA